MGKDGIVRLYGYILEGTSRSEQGVHSFPVGLVSYDLDKALWEQEHVGKVFDEVLETDVFPLMDDQSRKDRQYHIDSRVKSYLLEALKLPAPTSSPP